jgi:hypothetical protein
MAARLFDYYPPPDVGDPKVLLSGAVQIFLKYPAEAVDAVCDPVSGLPSTSKWAPNLAEIRSALDAEMVPIKWRQQQEHLMIEAERQIAARQPLQITDGRQRPTYEELRQRCADAGLMIGPKGRQSLRENPAKIREKYSLSQEQWDALPNAKRA